MDDFSNQTTITTTTTTATSECQSTCSVPINTTESLDQEETTTTLTGRWLLMAATLLLAFVIIAFNVLTIVVTQRTPSLRTLSNMYIRSLAVVDLMVGVALLPVASFFVKRVRMDFYDRHLRFCVFMNSFTMSAVCLSILHLMFISIDRCVYINSPYFYIRHITRRSILAVIVSLWLFGAFYTCVPQWLVRADRAVVKCDTTLVMPIEYAFYSNSVIYFLGSSVAMVMYCMILRTALKHQRVIRSLRVPSQQKNQKSKTSVNQCSVTKYARDDAQAMPRTSGIQKISLNVTTESPPVEDFASGQNGTSNRISPYLEKIPYTGTQIGTGTGGKSSFRTGDDIENDIKRFSSNSHAPEMPFKHIRFFATVFGVFFVCMTPAILCTSLDYYILVPTTLYNISTLLAVTNSAANFVIFFWLNKTFRNAVYKIIRRG